MNRPAAVSTNTFKILAYNAHFKSAFGLPSGGKSHLIDFVALKDKPAFFETYSKWQGPHDFTQSFSIHCAMSMVTDLKMYCRLEVLPIKAEDTDKVVFLITFEEAKEQDTQPSENEFLEGMRDIYFRIDLKGGINTMSLAAIELMGYDSFDEIIGANFFEKLSLGAKSLEETKLWKELNRQDGKVYDYEINLPRPSGRRAVLECNIRFYYGVNLEVKGIEGYATDVTANRLLIAELKRTLNFTTSLLQSLPTPLMYKDKDLAFEGCNQAFSDLTGISQADIIGKKAGDIWPPEFAVLSEQKEREALKSNLFQVFEGSITNKQGGKLSVIMVTACYPGSSGKPAGVISSLLDITARKAIELAINKQKEEISRENRSLKKLINPHLRKSIMVGNSKLIMELYDQVAQAARTNMPVLIEGESGTGKELVAKEIHRQSERADNKLIPVNCGAIPRELTESTFFGHVKGAFTGALEANEGHIRAADGGTLFLDEVNSIAMEKQAKLLRVLESGEVMPVGGTTYVKSNFRLISAANQDLETMVEQGKMRTDFYYRLKVFCIKVPPLRERKEDIPMLTYHFLNQFKDEHKESYEPTKQYITKELFQKLMAYDFPGNIRELRNILFVFFTSGNLILKPQENKEAPQVLTEHASCPIPQMEYDKEAPLKDVMANIEKTYITQMIKRYKYNHTQVAHHLGVSRKTLYNKYRAHSIDYKK